MSADDPGGLGASSVLLRDAKTYYTVLFEPHGEELLMEDLLADGHAARAEAIVVNVEWQVRRKRHLLLVHGRWNQVDQPGHP
ncbi:hypothetical protein ABZ400_35940 [Streptomyces sp. NPDC005897]|uniref:hypothetical protein n=1 Tax=Streptomyces sp. NPDC005897 TaxID=3157081 RepID=UPI0033DD5457